MELSRVIRPWILGVPRGDTARAAEIRSHQMAFLARHTGINSAVSMANSLVVAAALYGEIPAALLLPWAGAIWCIALWHLSRWWNRRHEIGPSRASERGPRRAALWTALAGAMWGGSVIFYPEASETQRLMIMMMAVGMAAGASTTLGAVPAAAAAFIVCSLVPWIGFFVLQGAANYIAMACLGIVLMMAMLLSTRIVYLGFIASTEVQRANVALLDQFHAERNEWLEISDTSEAFALFDENDRLLLWNENFRRILSLPADCLFRGAYHGDILRRSAVPVEVQRGRRPVGDWIDEQVHLYRLPAASVVQQLTNGRWLRSSARRTSQVHTVTLHVDITDQKRAEAALRESEERFRAIYERAGISIALLDKTGNPFDANQAFQDKLGYSNQEIVALGSRGYTDAQYIDTDERMFAELVEGRRRHYQMVKRYVGKDGRLFWGILSVSRLDTTGGDLPYAVAMIEDITEQMKVDEALRESERRFRDLIEGSRQGVLIHRDYKPLLANQALAEMFGYDSVKDVLELDSVLPLAPVGEMGRWAECKAGGTESLPATLDHDYEAVRNDGSRIWLHRTVRVVQWGDEPAVQSTLIDITERKLAEQALLKAHRELEESNRRFQDFAESSADWFWEMDADLRFSYMSPNVERIVGVPVAWHLGKTRAQLLDRASLGKDFDPDVWEAHFQTLQEHKPFRDFVYPRAGKGVARQWLRTSGVPICAEDGRFLGYRGTGSDVTAAVEAQQALRVSEEQLRLVTDSLPVLIAYVDRQEKFLFVNKTCTEWYGRPRPEILGKTVEDIHASAYGIFKPQIDAVLSGEPQTFERSITYGDGRTREMRIIYVPQVEESGQVDGFFALAEDVTARKAMEAAEKRAREALRERELRLRELQAQLEHVSRQSAMGQLSSALAHELNQPLTAIMNYAQAARRVMSLGTSAHVAAWPKAEDMLGKTIDQAERAGEVIHRLRTLFEKGETEQSAQDVNQVVEDAAALALVDAAASGIDYKLNLSEELPLVMMDRIQVQQVVLNLVRNAVEAVAGAKQRRLWIDTAQLEPGWIRISVSDTGRGLPTRVAERLFEPFMTSKHGGMGVGLSISHRIIEAHGGRLWAEPNPGGGTQFHFTLPIAGYLEGQHERRADRIHSRRP